MHEAGAPWAIDMYIYPTTMNLEHFLARIEKDATKSAIFGSSGSYPILKVSSRCLVDRVPEFAHVCKISPFIHSIC
jgi:hypothetical protein